MLFLPYCSNPLTKDTHEDDSKEVVSGVNGRKGFAENDYMSSGKGNDAVILFRTNGCW